jgi:hypothetical protein
MTAGSWPGRLAALARLLTVACAKELLAMMRAIFERNAFAERLAYGP